VVTKSVLVAHLKNLKLDIYRAKEFDFLPLKKTGNKDSVSSVGNDAEFIKNFKKFLCNTNIYFSHENITITVAE